MFYRFVSISDLVAIIKWPSHRPACGSLFRASLGGILFTFRAELCPHLLLIERTNNLNKCLVTKHPRDPASYATARRIRWPVKVVTTN